MITKAIITSINGARNRCRVRMPLFENASSAGPVQAEALVNITPGLFNNLFVGDIVFVAFEENALEKPIILGKLFKGSISENSTPGGAGILDTLKVYSAASIPSSTLFVFPEDIAEEYKNVKTPKKMADYIFWLEKFSRKAILLLDEHFRCFKNWVQWQFKPENVEVDDGDIDDKKYKDDNYEACKYQEEGKECKLCGNNCTKNKVRRYLKLNLDKFFPFF